MQAIMSALNTPLSSYSSDVSASGHGGSSASLVRFMVPPIASDTSSPPVPTAIRVGSWNVQHLNSRLLPTAPASNVLNAIASIINSHFDVIVLQEVAIATSKDVLETLQTIMRTRFPQERWELKLTHSKGEVHVFIYRSTVVLSTMDGPESIGEGLTHPAGMLFVECSIPRLSMFRLALLSVHLKSADPTTASAELTKLLQLISKHNSPIISNAAAIILLGDFNLEKAEIDNVLAQKANSKLKPRLVSWIDQTTMSRATSTKCNDNILVSAKLTVIERSARVVDRVDDCVDPHKLLNTLSDHWPVVLSVRISPPHS